MNRDFRSYKSSRERLTQEKAAEMYDRFDDNTKREARYIEDALHKYEGKSEAELMAQLHKLAIAERRKGTPIDEKLEAFARNVSPMLTNEQQARLSGLMRKLRR